MSGIENNNDAVRMVTISKSFLGVKALNDVNLCVKQGEVHALMGENGAGKSTLMKILTGIYQKDSGEIYVKDKIAKIKTPKDALEWGISMIHQELNPVVNMSVAENIFLGKEPCYKYTGIINKRKQKLQARLLFGEMGINLDPDARTGDLTIAEIQMVEIVKAVSGNAAVIVMDEPTSAITDREITKLFGIIQKLKKKGVAIVYISHKMDEIFRIADTITVLRDGRYIDSKPASAFNSNTLIRQMVGREITDFFVKEPAGIGAPILQAENLTRKGVFENINFTAYKGEVLGFAGLMGAGRTELMEAIFGISHYEKGHLTINGRKVVITSPADAIKHGMALISEDRKLKGLNLKASVKKNITLSNLRNYCIGGQLIDQKTENRVADEQITGLNIKTSGRDQVTGNLSGGNQQKVVLSKWFLTNPQILILDEPTRGIDIGAKVEIYKIISSLAMQGKSIIMVSSELPELMGLCDRMIVLHKGAITAEFQRADFNAELIMEAAMG